MSGARLAEPWGSRIDRGRAVAFTFNGRPYQGFHGDTLASALLANGVQLVGRSFKLHRPRGIFSCGVEEPTALVDLGEGARRTPNVRATMIELEDGLVACSVNCWPGVGFDLGAVNGWFSAMLPAGFYYKTFKWPDWHLFEPAIRRMAGLGRASGLADPDRYEEIAADADVLVIGGGVTGLSAALAAAENGAKTLLLTGGAQTGGVLGRRADHEVRELAAAAEDQGVRILRRTMAFGIYDHNLVCACETLPTAVTAATRAPAASAGALRERLWKIRARAIILAAGAFERPMLFPDNDRPGVMLADAARVYLHRYAVKVGDAVVVAAAHDNGYRVALDLAAAGVRVARVVDLREAPSGTGFDAARGAGLGVATGAKLVGTRGRLRVSAVGVETDAGVEWIDCDALLMAGGFTPSVHLYSQSRGKVVWDEARQMFLPGVSGQRERSAGACRGVFALAEALADGARAGTQAARAAGFAAADPAIPRVDNAPETQGGTMGDVSARGRAHAKAFVDFQNDVAAKDIRLAVREGMRSIEHVKRYTTTGMATDQGKTSNLNALAIAAQMLGKSPPQVGLTSFRPPYTPVTFGTLAGASRGELFDPVRRTPIHGWAEANGAAFEDVGLWKRAHYFARAGEDMPAAVAREVEGTRERVGLFDASTLGKIEVVGPDAAVFLERMYTNPFARLEVGRCRYAPMLNEQGFIMDDGVVARLAPDRFHVTTTTGGAARVLNQMEDYLQTEFPELKVWLTSTSEQWTTIAVQGPRARNLIEPFIEGVDISAEAAPHMSVREARFAGVRARLMRVSFTGELGFEINLPPEFARAAWAALAEAGRAYDAVAYGTEAMHVMRAEKGYIIVGQDTDGTVTPDDVGLAWAVGKLKKDFVGKRSLTLPDRLGANRKQLVGLLSEDPAHVFEVGAQVVDSAQPSQGTHALGHVTSSCLSPTLVGSIALALVENGRARKGERLYVAGLPAKVSETTFYDPEGTRLHA